MKEEYRSRPPVSYHLSLKKKKRKSKDFQLPRLWTEAEERTISGHSRSRSGTSMRLQQFRCYDARRPALWAQVCMQGISRSIKVSFHQEAQKTKRKKERKKKPDQKRLNCKAPCRPGGRKKKNKSRHWLLPGNPYGGGEICLSTALLRMESQCGTRATVSGLPHMREGIFFKKQNKCTCRRASMCRLV